MTAPATLDRAEEAPLSAVEFISGFHAIGKERYHHQHPFHLLMHEGQLTRGQLQAWALNRYYYQSHIPIKDAAILARSDDPARITPTTPCVAIPVTISSTPNSSSFARTTPEVRVSCIDSSGWA